LRRGRRKGDEDRRGTCAGLVKIIHIRKASFSGKPRGMGKGADLSYLARSSPKEKKKLTGMPGILVLDLLVLERHPEGVLASIEAEALLGGNTGNH